MGFFEPPDLPWVGRTFGKLTVIGPDPELHRGSWLVRCTCGTEFISPEETLLKDNLKSCPECIAQKRSVLHPGYMTRYQAVHAPMLEALLRIKKPEDVMQVATEVQAPPLAPVPAGKIEWAYIAGITPDRAAAIRNKLQKDGINCCGHVDGFQRTHKAIPKAATFVLLFPDFASHGLAGQMREETSARGIPLVYGVQHSWAITRERIQALGILRAAPALTEAKEPAEVIAAMETSPLAAPEPAPEPTPTDPVQEAVDKIHLPPIAAAPEPTPEPAPEERAMPANAQEKYEQTPQYKLVVKLLQEGKTGTEIKRAVKEKCNIFLNNDGLNRIRRKLGMPLVIKTRTDALAAEASRMADPRMTETRRLLKESKGALPNSTIMSRTREVEGNTAVRNADVNALRKEMGLPMPIPRGRQNPASASYHPPSVAAGKKGMVQVEMRALAEMLIELAKRHNLSEARLTYVDGEAEFHMSQTMEASGKVR